MKKGRPLKMNIKARKNAAWGVFAKYIRSKHLEAGFVSCYTCDKIMYFEDSQAGHGIGGRNNAVLFMEEVVKPQCERCNKWLKGNYKVFTLKLIKELGAERYEELLIKSNMTVKMTPMQFLAIQVEYEAKLEELTKE